MSPKRRKSSAKAESGDEVISKQASNRAPSPPATGSRERCEHPSGALGVDSTAQRFSTIVSIHDDVC